MRLSQHAAGLACARLGKTVKGRCDFADFTHMLCTEVGKSHDGIFHRPQDLLPDTGKILCQNSPAMFS